MLDAARFCELRHLESVREARGHRLLAVDVLAGLDRTCEQRRPAVRRRRIEKKTVGGARQRRVEVGGPALDPMRLGQRLELLSVAPDQQRIGHHALAIGEPHPALLADRLDRADEMLVRPHPPGDAVHDDTQAPLAHPYLPAPALPGSTANARSAAMAQPRRAT